MYYLVDIKRGNIIDRFDSEESVFSALFLLGGKAIDKKRNGNDRFAIPGYWHNPRYCDLKIMELPTYSELSSAGYEYIDGAWTAGYISRRADLDSLPSMPAGGSRSGLIYVDVPSFESTRYCRRLYFRKKD